MSNGFALRPATLALISICTVLAACGREETPEGPRSLSVTRADTATVASEPPAIVFTDITREAGIEYLHLNNATGERWMPEVFVGGIAFVDFDRDERPDIFAFSGTHDETRTRDGSTLAVYRNLGDGRFLDVTAELGIDRDELGFGVTVADLTSDGWPDLYLSVHGENAMLENDAGVAFRDVTQAMNVQGDSRAMSVVTNASDVDGDGDLDLIVGNYVDWSKERDMRVDERFDGIKRAYSHPNIFDGTPANYFVNNHPEPFSDMSRESGIAGHAQRDARGKVLGIVALPLNDDPTPDFLFANDSTPNFAFRSTAPGAFDEVANRLGFAYNNLGQPTAAMGIDTAWLGDGLSLHVAIGNFSAEMSSVYRFDEPGVFTDIAPLTGIGVPSRRVLTFGVLFADLDLDGRQDLVQVNGHVQPDIGTLMTSQSYAQEAQLFWNCGEGCSRPFVLVPPETTGDLARPVVGRGLAAADYDGDGDLDLLISSLNGPLRLLRNDQQSGNRWLRIRLEDDGGNISGIGAIVELTANGKRQRKQVKSSNSYASQSELILTFGLGQADSVEEVSVTWPDGQEQSLRDVDANQVLAIRREQRAK